MLEAAYDAFLCVVMPDKLFAGSDSKLPPSVDTLLAWSRLFRCGRTLRNYLGYVRTACLITKKPVLVSVFGTFYVMRQMRCL